MSWDTVTTDSEIVAIHAALLPTEPDGVVLYFGDWAVSGQVEVQEVTHSRLHRLQPGLADAIDDFPLGNLPYTDVFCGGQSFLGDGRLLTAGGTLGYSGQHEGIHESHYDGERTCWIYLPRAQRWMRIADLNFQPGSKTMGGGRWYPTVLTLASGEGFAVGGHPNADDFYPPDAAEDDTRHNNNTPERYAPGSDSWTLLDNDVTAPFGFAYSTDGYPRFHLMPSGLLFTDTAGADSHGGALNARRLFDPVAGEWTDTDVGNLDILPSYYDRGSAATSVLLPLLPPSYTPRVLACNSPDATAYRIDVDASPSWQQTTDRTGEAAGRSRTNACATLLPTGQVVVTGGWPGNAQADDVTEATVQPELYTPGIDWEAGDYSNTGDEEWVTLEDDPAPTPRGYHSTALLLPDGRVWHAGSTTDAGGPNKHIELFAPDYYDDAGRPTITACPDHVAYGLPFSVDTPQAGSIERVALMRCGSITHGFNSDQRYVGLVFTLTDANTLSVQAPPHGGIAPPGYYMLWLVDTAGRPCQRASFIRLARQKLVVTADISTFSVHEVDALGPPSAFHEALYVALDSFLPSEVTTPTYQLQWQDDNEPVPGMTATFGAPSYEAGADQADVAQRIVYPVRIDFQSAAAFDEIPDDEDFRTAAFFATMGPYVNFVLLQLSKNPNPRMRDGDPHYLSVDLRVFKTGPGEVITAGVEHPPAGDGAAGAFGYIQDVVAAYNDASTTDHPFDELSIDQEASRLELGINDANGDPAYNYAVARVRFIAPEGIDAADVRLFFRLWTTGWSAVEYDLNGSYRRDGNGPSATPLLGLEGGEINNVPCFAEPRVANMQAQTDETNQRTLEGDGSNEVFGYFGCWLDVNDQVERFPLEPQHDGPFTDDDDPDGLRSIQQLIRGLHQCLVAEIHYTLDPIPGGSTPGSSDNLAQRNILFDQSDNPGGFAAHLVHHTFELKPSPTSLAQWIASRADNLPAATAARLHPDELAIDWGELPRESLVTLYMPQLDTAEIVRAGAARDAPANLKAVAPGTLTCKVTDVGFIPIPGPLAKTVAGLITVQLPPGVAYGKVYKVLMRQISGRERKVLGATEFRIEVKMADELLPRFEHNLAVLKHILLSIPHANRWYPVFARYVSELGDRIRAFGGDPDTIPPSPGGYCPGHPQQPEDGGHGHGHPGHGHGDPGHGDPGSEDCVTGRVVRVLYDCFGTFEGFEVRDCDRLYRFDAHEPGVERVVLTACREHLRLTVCCRRGSRCPERLVLVC